MKKRDFIRTCVYGTAGIIALQSRWSLANKHKSDTNASKWRKETFFYELTPHGVKCLICPNKCVIKENEVGECKSRINNLNKLYTIAYGNPCAVHIDPVEKSPLYHFLPSSKAFSIATAGCNLSCLNCHNWTISQQSPKNTRNFDMYPDIIIEQAKTNKCKVIAYTYSEPITSFEYTYDTAKLARIAGIKNILVSAGYVNEKPLRYLAKNIDAAKIDLKSFSDSIYLKLNGGRLNPILKTLKILKEEGVWLEITNLIIPSWTDDFQMIRVMCEWLNKNGFSETPLHFSRFYPQYKLIQLPLTPVSTLKKARDIALSEGIKFVYISNSPGTEGSNTYCPSCKKTVIIRRGYQIMQNHIKNNKCIFCGQVLPGIWS